MPGPAAGSAPSPSTDPPVVTVLALPARRLDSSRTRRRAHRCPDPAVTTVADPDPSRTSTPHLVTVARGHRAGPGSAGHPPGPSPIRPWSPDLQSPRVTAVAVAQGMPPQSPAGPASRPSLSPDESFNGNDEEKKRGVCPPPISADSDPATISRPGRIFRQNRGKHPIGTERVISVPFGTVSPPGSGHERGPHRKGCFVTNG